MKLLSLTVLLLIISHSFSLSVTADDYSRIYLGSRPSVSPDGKSFVFEWCESIWKASTKGGTALPLEISASKDGWPVFSKDGKRVAFQSNRDGGWKIFVRTIEGGEVHQVTDHSERSIPLSWTKDEKSILSVVFRDDPGPYRYSRIALTPLEQGKAETYLFDTYGEEPALSPDGKKVLFTREGGKLYRKGTRSTKASQIWLYNRESGEFTEIIKNLTEARTPLWTPDGKGFYYVGGQDGAMNVRHRDLKSGKERQITFFKDDSVIHPSLSRNGTTMVFRHLFDFYVIDPRKKSAKPQKIIMHPSLPPLRPDYRRRYYNSCWNNDETGDISFCDYGMQIAFTTGGDLFVMDTKLHEPVCVHGHSLTHERYCAFSKDGRELFYISDHGDGSALWKAECTETNKFWWENVQFRKTVLLNDEKIRSQLQVSPDNNKLCWIEPVGNLVIADKDGIEITRHKASGGIGHVAWSPDSRWLAATMTDDYSNADIWILSADGKTPPCNISRHFSWDGHPCWSSDGKLIAFVGSRQNRQMKLFYVYVNSMDEKFYKRDRKIEKAQSAILSEKGLKKKEGNNGKSKIPDVVIDSDDIYNRVRSVEIKNASEIAWPFFSEQNPQTLAFTATINGVKGTWKISVPDNLTPAKMTDRTGTSAEWISKGDRLLWKYDRKPAHFNTTIPVNVYQETDTSDYQELGFLSAWGRLRDWFYDPNYHGADWKAIKEKYRMAARNAPSYSVFSRVIHLLNGELRASHLGFSSTDSVKKEWDVTVKNHSWEEETGHLGLIYDATHTAEGLRIKSIVPDSPADQTSHTIKPGDIVLSINRIPVDINTDPAIVMNGRAGVPVAVQLKSGTNAVRTVSIKPVSYKAVHELRNRQLYKDRRKMVKEGSENRFGYLHIAKMQWKEYYKFEKEIFAEGFGKEGMIIDVRDNTGGFTADHVINVLCGMNHSKAVMRGAEPAYLSGYWGRPVFDKPIVVLCNQNTGSNGEIFTHAMKTLKRGKIVGVPTSGAVIATTDHNLLDLGKLRLPHRGWFLPDGTDMEINGAQPDFLIWNTPQDEIDGKDRQLERAIEVLKKEVTDYRKKHPPFKPVYYKSK